MRFDKNVLVLYAQVILHNVEVNTCIVKPGPYISSLSHARMLILLKDQFHEINIKQLSYSSILLYNISILPCLREILRSINFSLEAAWFSLVHSVCLVSDRC